MCSVEICSLGLWSVLYFQFVQKDFNGAWPGVRNFSSSFSRECSDDCRSLELFPGFLTFQMARLFLLKGSGMEYTGPGTGVHWTRVWCALCLGVVCTRPGCGVHWARVFFTQGPGCAVHWTWVW